MPRPSVAPLEISLMSVTEIVSARAILRAAQSARAQARARLIAAHRPAMAIVELQPPARRFSDGRTKGPATDDTEELSTGSVALPRAAPDRLPGATGRRIEGSPAAAGPEGWSVASAALTALRARGGRSQRSIQVLAAEPRRRRNPRSDGVSDYGTIERPVSSLEIGGAKAEPGATPRVHSTRRETGGHRLAKPCSE